MSGSMEQAARRLGGAERGTREGRRAELVDAALTVITENGLAGATLARVAAIAGLSPGIVNHHFDTKESLLIETLRGLADEFSAALEAATGRAGTDPLAGLDAIIEVSFDPAISDPRKVSVWYAFHAEARWRDSYTALCGDRDAAYEAAILALITPLARDTGAEPQVLARAFAGLIDSYWQDVLFARDGFDREAAKAGCRRFLAAVFPAAAQAAAAKPAVVPFPAKPGGDATAPAQDGPAATLPAWTYRNDEFFALERQEIFAREWQLVCHQNQIPNSGDYRTLDFLGERLFVIRGHDGEIRGFHNVCRHRAHAVVKGTHGNCPGAVVCPYHGWSYELDGGLKSVAAPNTFARFEHGDFGLPRVDTEVFMGFVFVRMEGGGPSVAERFAPFAAEMAHYRFEDLVPIDEVHFLETGGDWKTVWDNYLEGYHFATGHPELARLMSREYEIEALPQRVSRLSHTLKRQAAKTWSSRAYQKLFEAQPHLPETMQNRWSYFFFFPLLSFDVYPEMIGTFQVVPTGPGTSRLRYQNYRLPEQDSRRQKALRWLNWRINGRVQGEDDHLVQSVQGGLASSGYTTGILSEQEVIVRNFQDWVRQRLPVSRLPRAPDPGTVARRNREMAGH